MKLRTATIDKLAKDYESALEKLHPLLDAAQCILRHPAPQFDDISDVESRKALEATCFLLHEALKALLELNSVYDDIVIALQMGRRFPWHGYEIRKSDHLKFIWFQHVNLCYLFEEKLKLVRNALGRVETILDHDFEMVHLSLMQKNVKKILGRHIRSRGQTFHEWYQHQESLRDYRMFEFTCKYEKSDGYSDFVERHYRHTKSIILREILASAQFMQACLADIFEHQAEHLSECLKKFELLWNRCRLNPDKIRLSLKPKVAA